MSTARKPSTAGTGSPAAPKKATTRKATRKVVPTPTTAEPLPTEVIAAIELIGENQEALKTLLDRLPEGELVSREQLTELMSDLATGEAIEKLAAQIDESLEQRLAGMQDVLTGEAFGEAVGTLQAEIERLNKEVRANASIPTKVVRGFHEKVVLKMAPESKAWQGVIWTGTAIIVVGVGLELGGLAYGKAGMRPTNWVGLTGKAPALSA